VIGPFPFDVVLVANRGEIAVRIIRTLQKLGLQSAVVYHEVDALSPAVALADHAIRISGRNPVSSYLDGDQIIAAALSVAAGAIHPGYGFLSENAVFARAVEAAGLIFVGPSADVIELMGDKIRARNFVARAGDFQSRRPPSKKMIPTRFLTVPALSARRFS
jgi:acetyl-CoA/propionyl-CoA carboxylase biotin carboxyl carrier protein